MERVLIIGSGAREHALTWKLAQDSPNLNLYCVPGNPGITELAECIPILADNPVQLAEFAKENKIDFTIVGPESALEVGVVDAFYGRNLAIFGPTKEAAQIETSKIWTKRLMDKYNIPTAKFQTFTPLEITEARNFLLNQGVPIVIKEDGIAGGKGASVVFDFQEALKIATVNLQSGKSIVVEEYLQGHEVSVTAICRGTDYTPLQVTEDQKKAWVGGPNTGGMGVYTPVPDVDKKTEELLYKTITEPTLNALAEEGIDFNGVLYSNIMLTKKRPMVLEHNARFGDPETQALMPRLKTNLIDALTFNVRQLEWLDGFGVSLTLVSGGYPGKYETGKVIEGIEDARKMKDILVFHAGTSIKDGNLVTAGGRVLSVVALGQTLEEAVKKVYEAASKINFEGMYYRKDIAQKCLKT